MTLQRAASAGLWSALDAASRHGIQFIASVVLARLLTPADFGIIALVGFFSNVSLVFVQQGVTVALVQRQSTTKDDENALFWLNLGASVLFGLLIILLSPVVARFYGEPVLEPLMFVAALQLVLSALGAVQNALLIKNLDFRRLAIAGAISTALAALLGIGAALLHLGVWALAIQITVAAASYSVILWAICSWRPSWRPRFDTVKGLVSFGAWSSLTAVMDVFYTQSFSLLIGKLHGVRDLGLYNRASATQLLPSTVLSTIVVRVALPLFSSRGSDREALRRGMRMATSLTMLLNVPIMIILMLAPDLVIMTLFGDRWLAAAPILSILALAGLLWPLNTINFHAVLAQGESRTLFNLEIVKKLIGIAALTIGSVFGILGLAWSQVGVSVIAWVISTVPVRKSVGYSLWSQLKDLSGIAAAAACMGIAVFFVSRAIDVGPFAELALLLGIGGVAYLGFGFAFRIRGFIDGLEVARLMLASVRPREAAL